MRNAQSAKRHWPPYGVLRLPLYGLRLCSYASAMNRKQQLILVSGDILVFVFFALTGRETHAPGDANLIVNALPTLLTFLIVWFVVAAVGRVYRADVIANVRSAVPHTLIAWIIAAPIAIVVRAILLGRTAIPWQFVAVTLGLVGSLLLMWHGGVAWYLARRQAP